MHRGGHAEFFCDDSDQHVDADGDPGLRRDVMTQSPKFNVKVAAALLGDHTLACLAKRLDVHSNQSAQAELKQLQVDIGPPTFERGFFVRASSKTRNTNTRQ